MKELMLRVLPRANDDGEFAIAARMWGSDVVFVSGSEAVRFTMRDGRVTEVSAVAPNTSAPIRITGPTDGWTNMMLPKPPPFYQDLFGAAAHHGFTIEGKLEDVYPYYPALRRLIELLRADNGA